MATTLISFIGTGRKKINGRSYDTTEYDFGSHKINTSMFFNAILRSKKYNLSEALVIGTKTSSWGTLLENNLDNEKYEDLYLKLEDVVGGISESLLKQTEDVLSEIWGMKINCLATATEINNDNAFNIISEYFKKLSSFKSQNLLIDITHGFRSMPILLMSALQLNESISSNVDSISLVYGEFNGEKSYVRELDAIWQSVKISRAVNIFFQKFDATELSEIIAPFWSSGAKAIDKLGSSLQGNLLIWLDETLKQLNNALGENIDDAPLWFFPIHSKIEELYNTLSCTRNKSQLCLSIASMFADRHVYGQAIIALQLSFEAFIFEFYCVDESFYGDFEKNKELSKRFFKIKALTGQDKNKLHALNNTRNTIAHGGSRSTHGGKPQVQNLPSQYKSYRDTLLRIMTKLKQGV